MLHQLGFEKESRDCLSNATFKYIRTPTEPISGPFDFYTLNLIVSATCNGFAVLLGAGLMTAHSLHFSKPLEQLECVSNHHYLSPSFCVSSGAGREKKMGRIGSEWLTREGKINRIMRICLLLPWYAILTMGAVYEYNAYPFVKPWIEVMQGYALANLWILICRFLAPEGTTDRRDIFLAPFMALNRKRRISLRRYRRHFFYVLQGPVVTVVIAVIANIVEVNSHFCILPQRQERLIRMGLTGCTVVSMTLAMVTAIRHSATLRPELWPHRALFKMLSFKLLLGLYIILQVIYIFLDAFQILKPSNLFTAGDLEVGIPMMATSCELALFALFYQYAYWVAPYRLPPVDKMPPVEGDADHATPVTLDRSGMYQGGRFGGKAWRRMLNHREMWEACKFPFELRVGSQRDVPLVEFQRDVHRYDHRDAMPP
ncbi:hypothetical protein DL764_007989 [Monosporascus ibericus]|uniref:DUF300 domain protein n=1 Tax=Monosporascus ibericus TaxID=155417 RepID=A0A4Q4SYP4_9PEZI|nr:hypothetical protein DL764_007989 [Monosporascus ibericus]